MRKFVFLFVQIKQGNPRTSKWEATQIFQIRLLLVYLGLHKGDKSDFSIFSMIIFGFFLIFLVFGLLFLIWVSFK